MEPIPESQQALDEMDPVAEGDNDLLDRFREAGEQVLAVVPQCVGFSISRLAEGLVFTMLSTDEDAALLDAMQYLDDGPCVQSVRTEEVVAVSLAGPLDEERWRLFTETADALGVRSSMTMPTGNNATVTGSINLYASTPHAFDGHHEALALVFGAWPADAVLNADLSFATRGAAQQAPRIMADLAKINTAAGILAVRLDLDVDQARDRLRQAANTAGLSEATLARNLIATSIDSDADAVGPEEH